MPAKKHDFTVTEIKAGIFVLVSIALFIMFVAAILNWRPQSDFKTYYAYFSNTSGLRLGGDVRFGGVKSGWVMAIEPAPDRQSMIRVTAAMDPDIPVNEESTAYITQLSLTSEYHLEISTGSDEAALLESEAVLPPGAGGLFGQVEVLAKNVGTLLEDITVLIGVSDVQGEPTMSGEEQQTIAELFVGMENLMSDLQVLLGVTDAEGNVVAADGEQPQTVAQIFAELDTAVKGGGDLIQDLRDVVEETKPSVETLLDTAEELLEKAVDVGEAAEDLVQDVDGVLAENKDRIGDSLESAQGAVEEVELLVKDLREMIVMMNDVVASSEPALEEILLDLRDTLQNVKTLTGVLSEQPQSLIRGRTPTGRQ